MLVNSLYGISDKVLKSCLIDLNKEGKKKLLQPFTLEFIKESYSRSSTTRRVVNRIISEQLDKLLG
mgnify:CR=1 FL=1|tara:strand:+ start:434 stop:631 length:198 start_codon:yes stop_codon:yes gene_type:complete